MSIMKVEVDPYKEQIEEFRKIVLDDKKLRNCRTEDEYLLRYLHCTNFDIDLAFKRLKDNTDYFLAHPTWFTTTPPFSRRDQIERHGLVLLSKCDRQKRPIFIIKLGNVDTDSTPAVQAEVIEMWMEYIMDDPRTQMGGLTVILDMNGYSLKLFRWLTPSNVRIATKRIDLYPLKDIFIHIVNTSFLLNASIKIIWPFMSEKVKNMIKFNYNDWSALHEYINPEVLPSEYGGTGADIDYEKAKQLLYAQNFEIEAKVKFRHDLLKQL